MIFYKSETGPLVLRAYCWPFQGLPASSYRDLELFGLVTVKTRDDCLPLPSWSPVIAADPLSKFESSRTSSNHSDNQVLSSFRLLLPTNLLYNLTRLSGVLLKDLVRYRSKSSCSYLKLTVYRYGFIGIQREIDSPKTWTLWNSRTFKLGVSSDD